MRGILFLCFVALTLIPTAPDIMCSALDEDEASLVLRLTTEEQLEWYSLRYAMPDLEQRMYLSRRTPKERRAWIERFWAGLDPTPGTAKNERRLEHDQRIELARVMFSRREPPGWDARGETLIRFGLPDYRHRIEAEVTFSGAYPPREIWYYQKLAMVVNFEDLNHRDQYTFAMNAVKAASRPGPSEPDNIDYTADKDIASWEAKARDIIGDFEHEKYLKLLNSFFTWRDTRQSVYSCDLEDALTLYFDIVTCRTSMDSLMTEVCFEIPVKEIGLVETNGILSGEVEISILARDRSLNPVARAIDTVRVAMQNSTAEQVRLVPARIALALKPGFYSLAIAARDSHSRRRADLKADISISDLNGTPDISDIRFASSIRDAARPNAFVRDGLEIVPHPIHAYRIPFPLTLYFEIYGLSTDRNGRSLYRVEYTIVPRKSSQGGKSRGGTVVTSAFESGGTGSRQTQRLQIETNNLWEGAFELLVKVTDRLTRRSTEKIGRFSVFGK